MSTVYVVLSHRQPDQVLRLARTLRTGSPSCTLVLHHDDRHVGLDETALAALGRVERVLPPTPVAWGWTSQLDMLVRCLRHALDRVDFEWLVVLSGQDYPIRPLEVSERELRERPWDAYVERVPVAPPSWSRTEADEFARRYFYRYRPIRPPGPVLRRVVSAARPLLTLREMPWGTVLGVRGRRLSEHTQRGADWLTLSRAAVEAVVDGDPVLMRHYRRALMPTESYPHTVLHTTVGMQLSGDTRRFTRWDPGSPNPAVLGVDDLDAMLASGNDFARKFDPDVDARVLDELDRVVLG